VKLVVRAESRIARQDNEGARQSLEQAVAQDDSVSATWRALGLLYDTANEYDKALAAYRKVVALEPKDALALNNLAYAMAIREGNPKDALPIAERALLLAPRNPAVADTVGWIKHLLGDNSGAVKLLQPAAKVLPANGEVQLHAAIVLAELGRFEEAAAALKAAQSADPAIKDRPEFAEAQKKIGK
jgi:tetratricopeptide (TPR) repeat protein